MTALLKKGKTFLRHLFSYLYRNRVWSPQHVLKLAKANYKPKYPRKKIAFLLPNFITLEHIENILTYLNTDEFDFIHISYSGYDFTDQKRIEEYTRKRAISCFSINYVIRKKLYYNIAAFMNPEFAGTVFYDGKRINGMEYLAQKFVQLIFKHGGYSWWYNREMNMITDFIICSSAFHRKAYEKIGIKAKIFVLGSPRFEKYSPANEEKTQSIKNLINPVKKTILWLPTHTGASSIIDFIPVIKALQNQFNIILKPHPQLYIEIKNLNALLRASLDIIILEKINNLDIFPVSDFVFCDYGGSVFTAIKADKNVLFLNTDKLDVLENIFGQLSPEIMIRDKIINFNKNQEKDIVAALHDSKIWEDQKEIRKQIRDDFFYENQNASHDIADKLRQIANNEI